MEELLIILYTLYPDSGSTLRTLSGADVFQLQSQYYIIPTSGSQFYKRKVEDRTSHGVRYIASRRMF